MHPQNMQISNMLHVPHVTAINGQVKVSSLTTQEEHKNKKTAARTANKNMEGVAHLLIYRDVCLAFWLIVPPLLIVPSLACSVTSLSLCPEP